MTQIFTLTAIAAITSTATISFTNHLLSRPWCLQLQADGEQYVAYGYRDCHLPQEPPLHHSPSLGDRIPAYIREIP